MWRSPARLGLCAIIVALAWAALAAAHSRIDWLPIVLLVIGLILAAGTAGQLAFRGLRQDGRETVAATIEEKPPACLPPSRYSERTS